MRKSRLVEDFQPGASAKSRSREEKRELLDFGCCALITQRGMYGIV